MRDFMRRRQWLTVALGILILCTIAVGALYATTIYDLRVTHSAKIQPQLRAMRDAVIMYENSTSWTLDADNYGYVYDCPGKAAQTITLPAAGASAGYTMTFIGTGDNNYAPVFTAETADTLIAPNNATADSVTFGTGHRIGFCLKLVSNGTYWIAINLGSTTMTVTDS